MGDEASSILIGRWPAVSGGARVSSYDLTKVLLGRAVLAAARRHGQAPVVTQQTGVRTMRFRKADGNKRGAANGRILRRSYHIAAAAMDAGGPSIPIEKMNMLQRLRYASDYFFALAERERKKGDRANVTVIVELMQAGAMSAVKAAPYLPPRLTAMPFEVSQPQPRRQPQDKIDLDQLTIEEHEEFLRLMKKAKVTTSGEAQDPIPSDEYRVWPTARTRPSRASGS